MKKLILLILLFSMFSCYDGLNKMYENLIMKVPVCVDSRVASSGDGRGWLKAYKTIQEAVDNAEEGDEIWVAAGTYRVSGADPDFPVITVTKSVAVYGGFLGNESSRDERNFETNLTVFKADNATKIMNISGVTGVNINGIIFEEGGYSSQQAVSVLSSNSINFSNCTFKNGYELNISGSSAVMEKCKFLNNIAGDSEPGGAINVNNSTVKINSSGFYTNKVNNGMGGALYSNNSDLTISDSIFKNNSAYDSGGAIYFQGAAKILSIRGCNFESNSSSGAANPQGGAVCKDSGTGYIINSLFYDNYSDSHGGAVYSNSASTFVNDTFYKNNANPADALISGGAIYMMGNHFIYNTIFYDNTAGFTGGSRNSFVEHFSSNVDSYNCYYDSATASALGTVENCIDSNASPFINIIYGSSSFLYPADDIINRGDNSAPGLTVKDLAGNWRVVNSVVDIGAYERQ